MGSGTNSTSKIHDSVLSSVLDLTHDQRGEHDKNKIEPTLNAIRLARIGYGAGYLV